MGALHKGHLSLIQKSRRENDIIILSIFVNPKQFGPKEDFTQYPRQEKKDELLAKKEKVDIIFYPSVEELYPKDYLTYVFVDELGEKLCGQSRPNHFQGVTTIVAKLLNIITPDTLYLGQKDAQQVIIINKMIQNLNIPVKVKTCPIIREPDGLAMSSRNRYLSSRQRKEAPILFQSLKSAKKRIQKGEHRSAALLQMIQSNIERNSSGRIDYLECVDNQSLNPLKKITSSGMIALAVKFGSTRLIDNIEFKIK